MENRSRFTGGEKMKKKTFTLTEILVVMAVMAIMAMMMLPVVAPLFRDRALDASVMKVQGIIMKARSLAAKQNLIYYLGFNTLTEGANMVLLYDSDPTTSNNIIGTPVLLQEMTYLYFKSGSSGENCFLIFSPTGEITDSINFRTKSYNPPSGGVLSIKISDSLDPATYTFKTINLMLLTGEMYKE